MSEGLKRDRALAFVVGLMAFVAVANLTLDVLSPRAIITQNHYTYDRAKSAADQKKPEGFWWWWPSPESWTAIFTGTLFVSTVGLWWATWGTLKHAREDSARQSRDTHIQLELIRRQFVAAHRPRVILRTAEMRGDDVVVLLANAGDTIAKLQVIAGGYGYKRLHVHSMSPNWANPPGLVTLPLTPDIDTLASGQRISVTLARGVGLHTMLSGHEFFIVGVVRYEDANEAVRETSFIRRYERSFGAFLPLDSNWAHADMEYAE